MWHSKFQSVYRNIYYIHLHSSSYELKVISHGKQIALLAVDVNLRGLPLWYQVQLTNPIKEEDYFTSFKNAHVNTSNHQADMGAYNVNCM